VSAHLFTFLEFELNLRSEVLKKAGVRVRLASRPLRLLALLVRRAGELVTREEIHKELWTKGSVVDFDHVVNQYIRQLRTVLGDSRETPTFIETAPRRGYRFIAPVSTVEPATAVAAVNVVAQETGPVLKGHAADLAVPAVGGVPAAAAPETASATHSHGGQRKILVASMAAVAGILLVAAAVVIFNARGSSAGGGSRRPQELAVSAHAQELPGSPAAAAHAAYIKGKFFFNQSSVEGFQKSCEYFRLALKTDSTYALAYKGMADCYMALSSSGQATADESMPKAKAMASKAIELDESLAEGHAALGVILLNYEWNWPAAYVELSKAVRLDPANVDSHFALAAYYGAVGQVEAAASELLRVQALAPASEKGYFMRGWLYVYAGRYAEATGELQKCIELSPYNALAHFGLFRAYSHVGRQPEAMSEVLQYLAIAKETDIAARVKRTYQVAGFAHAQREYFELMADAMEKRHYLAFQIAGLHALLGDNGRALDFLEQAYRDHSNYMTHLKVDSFLDGVRGEPRFQRLLEQMKLTDAQLQAAAQLAAANH
jgi:DNA-binding winged helix-turn-helix (wHTH) protein/tetratricopeptide (TPR) repeat protein